MQGMDALGILAGGEEGEDVQSHLSRGHVCGDKRAAELSWALQGQVGPRELVLPLLFLPTFLGSPHRLLLDLLEQPLVDGTIAVPPSQVHGQQDTGICRLLEVYRSLHALEQLGDQVLWGHWKERGGHQGPVSHPWSLLALCGWLTLTTALGGRAAHQGQQDPDAQSHTKHPSGAS